LGKQNITESFDSATANFCNKYRRIFFGNQFNHKARSGGITFEKKELKGLKVFKPKVLP
jgi:hypothetical protein